MRTERKHMNGQTLWNFLEAELKRQNIRKAVFYDAIGITATAYYGRKNGAVPKAETLERIENYLGIDLSTIEKSDIDDETAAVLQWIREDYGHRALFEAARHLSTAESLDAAAYIVRLKAGEMNGTSS